MERGMRREGESRSEKNIYTVLILSMQTSRAVGKTRLFQWNHCTVVPDKVQTIRRPVYRADCV